MAAKNNVGTLIREARTAKKISQEQLASQIDGLSGSDIGKAERGEKELTQTQLKAIAKILGITQKSLLEAPKGGYNTGTSKTSTAGEFDSGHVSGADGSLLLSRSIVLQTRKSCLPFRYQATSSMERKRP